MTIAVRINPPSVKVVDEAVIPQCFKRLIPEQWQVDKKAILENWKDERPTPEGVEIVTDRKRVEIK